MVAVGVATPLRDLIHCGIPSSHVVESFFLFLYTLDDWGCMDPHAVTELGRGRGWVRMRGRRRVMISLGGR